MFAMLMLQGTHRPALASLLPTLRGETVMLDLGANVECDAENLVQFAVMGDVFARTVRPDAPSRPAECRLRGPQGPRGGAPGSGRLRGEGSPVHFHGFVEGDDIAAGTVDVVVTDGFTGNVALKTIEGTAKLLPASCATRSDTRFAAIGYLFASGAWRSCASGSIRGAITARVPGFDGIA